jgi:cystathionine beta-lyase
MKFATKAVHAGAEPDAQTGAVMTPIYQTSTYAQASPGNHKGFEYSRTHNPTRTKLHEALAALENGKYAFVFSSGMGAIDTVLKMLQPGDEVISTNDLYGGTYRLFTKTYARFGVGFHFVNLADPGAVESLINEKTKWIWVETPTNPTLNIIDIEVICRLAHKHGVKVAVDNTFASPYLQNPLNWGADLVMHSITKYLGGHSDTVMGGLIVNDDTLAEQIAFNQNATGAVPGPQDCFLVLRGMKTLHLRMERHCENAGKVVEFLKNHPAIDKIYYPGLPSHPGHEVAKKQMKAFGGMVSFTLKNRTKEAALKVLSNTHLFTLAESLGGVESLIGHPATMTHASIPKEEREKTGVVDSLIRLSVGIEDAEDLIDDLNRALNKL